MKNFMKKIGAEFIVACMILPLALPVKTDADTHLLHNMTLSVNGGEQVTIRALDEGYENNLYLSLRDVSTALAGSDKAFLVSISDSEISVVMGEAGDTDRSLTGWSDEERAAYYGKSLAVNDFTVDGNARKYYTIRASYQEGTDCFISFANLAMMLDCNIYSPDEEHMEIDTSIKFQIDPESLAEAGFFWEVSSALAGDATTGQIFYEYNGDVAYPIASTTKLMTYLLTEDAIARGDLTEDTMVTISEDVSQLSQSSDGVTPMAEGLSVPVSELIIGALLPSSNECALALGEQVGGSEEAFVTMMNDKASELSMTTARFYNPNGLPSYDVEGIPGKRQNTASAEDMFKLSAHILNTYPQVKNVTSLTDASLPNIGRDVKNTNALLYNMPEVNGLKTGTTDSAGACLVTSLTVNDGTMDHDLVVVVLGAEGSKARFTVSELMAYYAKNVLLGNEGVSSSYGTLGDDGENGASEDDAEVEVKKIGAEELVKMVVNGAFKLRNTEY